MNKQRLDSKFAATAARYAGMAGIVALGFSAGLVLAGSKTYTLNADFDLGALSGVNHTVPDQLQLNPPGQQTTFPVLWIANASEDTLTKFDSAANVEVARYRTWFRPGTTNGVPHGGAPWSGPAPSRTAVDLNGDAYVLNRHFEGRRPLLMKILANGFIDRNGNSIEDTSSGSTPLDLLDTNPTNGVIDTAEIRDERIAWAINVGAAGSLGRSLCLAPDGLSLWVGTFSDQRYYQVRASDGAILAGPIPVSWTPYGCVVDSSGILWSASLTSRLGRLDTTSHAVSHYDHGAFGTNYVVTVGNGKVYLAIYSGGTTFVRFDPNPVTNPTNTFADGVAAGAPRFTSTGIAVDGAGNIIAGNYWAGGIVKYRPDGTLICSGPAQSSAETRGIIVDQGGNYWQANLYTNSLSKYTSSCAPLFVRPVGNNPYTYSDASGFAARNLSGQTGTWTVTKDGGITGARWSNVKWTETLPAGTSTRVSIRSADSEALLPSLPFTEVTNGGDFTSAGRYLQVEARLNTTNPGNVFTTPILYDLTVASKTCDIDNDGDVDRNDINAIFAARNTAASGFADPKDANGDGRIDTTDSRTCTLRCTRALCAP